MVQVIPYQDLKSIYKDMRGIYVHPKGIEIMAPKAISYAVKLKHVKNFVANILKQESLSEGADVAIARDALTGKLKTTDCLIMGNISQLNRITKRLKGQPLGLGRIGSDISQALDNYSRKSFRIDLPRFKLNLGRRTLIMGILNLTPDSFSGDGLYKSEIRNPKSEITEKALRIAEKMAENGADIIDVGGQSSRPGSSPVSEREEIKRTIPVIKKLAKKIKLPISVDTYKAEVARQALDNGASIVNDISSLHFDKNMVKIVKRYKAGLILMHMKGRPKTMQENPVYENLIEEIIVYLGNSINRAVDSGIDREKIIIDPGIGFGKTLGHNLEILKRLKELKVFGRPILVGASRKSFIGKILKKGPCERIIGTIASCVCAILNGAHILRVHDVDEVRQAVKIIDNIVYLKV